MTPRRERARIAAALLAAVTAVAALAPRSAAQSTLIVAPGAALVEGNQALPGPGLPNPLRLQVLIDQAHLGPLVGRAIRAVRLRRQGHARPFAPGSASWTLRLASSPFAATAAQPTFAANLGPILGGGQAVAVLAPASPVPLGTAAQWTPATTLELVLPTPVPYPGGTLVLDLAARPDPLQPPTAWPIDASSAPRPGAAVLPLGAGCGAFGPRWAFVDADSLLPGGTAKFSAMGTPGGLGLFFVGTARLPVPLPLDPFGSAPGCMAFLADTPLSVTTVFSPPTAITPGTPGLAVIALPIPRSPAFVGVTLLDHWVDLGQPQFATSDPHAFTLGAVLPGLGITTVLATGSGAAVATAGIVLPDFGPALQFVY